MEITSGFGILCLLWSIYWIYSSRGVKKVQKQESLTSRIIHLLPLVLGIVLMSAINLGITFLDQHIFPEQISFQILGLLMACVGLSFTVWARKTLGRNWSGTVTLKEDHSLIQSGPYQLARHPIYTGVLFAALGWVIALHRYRDTLGFALFTISFLRKIQIEESFLTENFGEKYRYYKQKTKKLIPGIW